MHRRGRGHLGPARVRAAVQPAELLHHGGHVIRGPRVGRGQVLPEQRGCAAGPEHQPDPQADREADRDVLDPQDPDFPAGGRDDVEQDHNDHGERGLAGGERDHPGRVGRHEHRDRENRPQHGGVALQRDEDRRADDDAHGRPGQRADHRPAGAQRVGAQYGQGAQHDPERVLETGFLGDEHRDGQAHRAADTVAEPDRAVVRVGQVFRAGQPGPQPAGPAARDGDLAGQRVGAGVRRDRPGSGRQVGGTGHPLDGRPVRVRAGRARIRGDLPRGVGDRVDPEPPVHLGLQRRLVREVRQFRDPPGQQLGRALPGPLQPLGRLLPGRVASGQLRPALHFAGAGPEHPGDRPDRGGVLGCAQLAVRDAGQDFQRLEQPAQLVDEPGQGGRRAGRPGWPVRRGGQPAAQPGDRLPRRIQGGSLGLATADGIGQRGQGQAALGCVRPQRRAFPRRPEQHHGQDADG